MINAKEARETTDSVLKKSFDIIEEFVRYSANDGENSTLIRWINKERKEDIKITSDLPVIMTTFKAFFEIQNMLKENGFEIKVEKDGLYSNIDEKAKLVIKW